MPIPSSMRVLSMIALAVLAVLAAPGLPAVVALPTGAIGATQHAPIAHPAQPAAQAAAQPEVPRVRMPAPADTVAITARVIDRMVRYFTFSRPGGPVFRAGEWCLADEGDVCRGLDHDRYVCDPERRCDSPREMEELMNYLLISAVGHPRASFVVGYAAYTHVRLGRPDVAMVIADACSAAEWWCDLVAGHAYQRQGTTDRSVERLERALALAPAVGVYWETFGADMATPVDIGLAVEGGRTGFVRRLVGILPGVGTGNVMSVDWEDVSTGAAQGRNHTLDLSALDPGTYTLVLRTRWADEETIEVRRPFEIR